MKYGTTYEEYDMTDEVTLWGKEMRIFLEAIHLRLLSSGHCPKHGMSLRETQAVLRNSLANILGCKQHHIKQNVGT